ncbi:MAG: LysR family transcriptional regulator [Oscillospiraceae bacterium]
MNLYQLYYFKTLCDKKSFSATASAMHVSPPAITIAIQKLENEFDIQLYDHEKRGFELTEIGTRFLELTVPVLEAADLLQSTISFLRQDISGKFRVGCPRGYHFDPNQTYRFVKQFPKLQFSTIESSNSILVDSLLNNTLDCALVSIHAVTSELEYVPYSVCEYMVAIPQDRASFAAPTIDIHELDGYDVFVSKDEPTFLDTAAKYFAENDVHVTLHSVNAPMPSVLNSTLNTKNLSFVSRCHDGASYKAYRVEPPLKSDMVLAWKKKKQLSEPLKAFIKTVKTVKE